MKKVCFALFLVFLTTCGFAGTFRILGVEDYASGASDLSNEDGDAFYSKLKGYGWSSTGYYADAEVTGSKFRPSTSTDYVYFTGHGTEGAVIGSNGYSNSYIRKGSIGRPQTARNIIFASCLSVNSLSSWDSCFGSGLRSVLGYHKISFERIDTNVAKKFAARIRNLSATASQDNIYAWYYSNQNEAYGMTARFAAIGYRNGQSSLSYFRESSINKKKGIIRQPIMSLAQGKVEVLGLETSMAKSLRPESASVLPAIAAYQAKSKGLTYIDEEPMHHDQVVTERNLAVKPFRLATEQVLEIAYEHVHENGGIPADYTNSEIRTLVSKDLETGEEHTMGYTVTWNRNIQGIPVDGFSGDRISVHVTSEGVGNYFRLVRNAQPDPDAKPVIPMTREEALLIAAQEMAEAIKGEGKLQINSADLIYYAPSYRQGNTEFVPAYRFNLADGGSLFVSALNGKLLMD